MFDSRMFFIFVSIYLALFGAGVVLTWEGLKWLFHHFFG